MTLNIPKLFSHSHFPEVSCTGRMPASSPVTNGRYDLLCSRRFDKIVRFRECLVPGSLSVGVSGKFSRKPLKYAERD